MLYARLSSGNWVIGIEAENVRRLTSGDDMLINLQAIDPKLPQIMMIYAADMDALKQRLQEASGETLPTPQKL